MSEIKSLLKSLLKEIYGHTPSSVFQKRVKKEKPKMHPKLYEKRLLEKLSPKVLKDICEILKFEIRLISKYLERVLISRDKNRTHRTILCGFLDILATSRFGESSREMRFGISSPPNATQKGRGDAAPAASASVASASASAGRSIIADETNSSSDFNQWLHAMKMVARLPGGMPPEFRRKLWLALADKYLKSKNVDWEKEEVKCFSEQWREDDEELGIQIVKDLHRTGSSLCSGPAGTINQAKLKRILLGYARFNPEVGYCQGFNMLGALILQVMDKEEIESIKVMIYLVEGILPSGYFSGSLGGLQADMAVFRELMTSKLPRLAKHLQKLQGPVENAFEPPLTNVFTMQWFLTMFCTCLPMTCVLRVWDLVLIEGSDVLLRTALVLWSLLEERILSARTADDFYCQMGSFSSELLNGHLVDSNGLIEKVVDLGPITDLQKLRDKHLYNITPFRDKKGLQLYYSDEDGDSDEDSRMAVATAWGLRLRRGSAGLGAKTEGKDRIALDISLLKKQYDRLRERQRQAHIILTSAVARQGSNPNQASIQMNQLLIGRNAIVTNNGRRLGPPQGAIPPARKPSLPTSKPPKLAQTKKLLSGETLHWRDTDLSKRRRGSLKWKDIKSDSSQSGMEDRPTPVIESAPSSRSSSSEPKSRRTSMKASRQRSDSSSYSEESDGNSSTSTSLCDEDEIADHNLSSLEGSPMRKVKSSKKHSEVSKQKSLEDVLNSNDGQPTVDNQIPFIQLTTIESPVLNANKTDAEPLEYGKEDSETESNRLDYAGFVDDFSWPDINEPTSSVSLEDTTVDATSVEGDFLSLSNVITSTSQLSPIPDITTYINNSNISPLRTPISTFNYSTLVANMDDSKKFDVNEEGVTNEYFERVNIVERPTKLDLLYSLNEEDSIRNAYVSCEPSLESSKVVENPKVVEPEISNTTVNQISDEELERKMKVLQEYSNKSSLSFIAEAKHEISSGMFKEMEFDVDSLKYQPSELIPLKKPHSIGLKTDNDNTTDQVIIVPSVSKNTNEVSSLNAEVNEDPKTDTHVDKKLDNLNSPQVYSSPKNLAEELAEIEFKAEAGEDEKLEKNVKPEEIENIKEHSYEDEVSTNVTNNIPSTEDLETRYRALEMGFSDRKESLKNGAKKDSPKSIQEIDNSGLMERTKEESPLSKEVVETRESSSFSKSFNDEVDASIERSAVQPRTKKESPISRENDQTRKNSSISKSFNIEVDTSTEQSTVLKNPEEDSLSQLESRGTFERDAQYPKEGATPKELLEDVKVVEEVLNSHPSSENVDSKLDQNKSPLHEKHLPVEEKEIEKRSSSIDKEHSENTDLLAQDKNLVSQFRDGLAEKILTVKEDTGNINQSELPPEEKLETFSGTDLPGDRYHKYDQPAFEDDGGLNNEQKRSSIANSEQNFLSPKKQPSIEDLNKKNSTDTKVTQYEYCPSMENKISKSSEEVNQSKISTESKEDIPFSVGTRDHFNDEWKSSDLHYEYRTPTEESSQLQISEDVKTSSECKKDPSFSNETTSDMDNKSGDQLSAEVEQKHQKSSFTEPVEEEKATDQKETTNFDKDDLPLCSPTKETLNVVPKIVNQQNKSEEGLEERTRSSDGNLTSHSKEENISTTKELTTKGSNSKELTSEVKLGTAPKVEASSFKDEELSIQSSKKVCLNDNSKSDDVDGVHETSPLKTTAPIEPNTYDPQLNIEDLIVKNLSDDSKQSLLPKEVKRGVHSSTTKDSSSEGVLYYEHHSANEYGSEAEGLNDPQQSEDYSMQNDQTTKNEKPSSQEKAPTPVEVESGEDRSIIVKSTTTENDKALQKVNEKEQNLDPITTVDKALSTYSFSYKQDQFKDHVSFLSEVQSSIPTKSTEANQDTYALQSTIDLKHSLQNLVAVTTSVSVRNSASVKSSVSIKSSVSLKSSSLYDKERSLNFNTGITVFEDAKFNDSKMMSSNQLELSESNKNLNEDNFRLSQNLRSDNKNNGVTVGVLESEYKALHTANTSNISVSMQLPNFTRDGLERKHSKTEAILEREALQIVDESTAAIMIAEDTPKNKLNKNGLESSEAQMEAKAADESQKMKSSNSQDIEERLKILEKRLSDRALSISKDTKSPIDPSANKDKEPNIEQIQTLDDIEPMKLKHDASLPNKSSPELETTSKQETEKVIPSTADLEHRFHELERKLSAKNIHMPAKIDEQHEEGSSASKQSTPTVNPSIVLSKNEEISLAQENSASLTHENVLQTNEVQQNSSTRRRIPSTEDLETRFDALEIQKSLKSPTNLLSPSKIKEEFLEATTESESNRKSEIPSTEDLENRFQALEESKKGGKVLKTTNKDLEQTKLCKNMEIENVTESQERPKTSTTDSETRNKNFKAKEIPKVTFADASDIKIPTKKSSDETEKDEEVSPTACDYERPRILRKVPSARDLEARFEALEKRKSFTGFSTKTQEHLLAEQNRNYLSSDSINSVESLRRRELNDKKVASTEDLVLRLDALEQRMAITENSIRNKISADNSDVSSQTKKKLSPKLDFECKFEALDNIKSFGETATKENTSTKKPSVSKQKSSTFESQPKAITLTNDMSQEMKLSLIKRSLFEPEPEPKWLPSTEDLENRFDALERQKNKSLSNKKKTVSEKEVTKTKSTSHEPQTKSTQHNWETRFEAIEHRTPKTSSYSKIIPTLETQSKFPSTKDLESRFEALEQQKSIFDRSSTMKDFQKRFSNEKDFKPAPIFAKPVQQDLEKPTKALSSRSIDQVLEQISTKTEEIEREHQMVSKLPSTQDLEIRYHDLQLNTKRGDECDVENVQNLEQTTDSIELTGNHKRRDLYKLESQSDETLTVSDPTGTEFETKCESRPTSCPEYRDPFDSNIVTTDRVLKIIEENSKILHRILKKTLADSGGNGNSSESMNSRSGFTDSLLALGNIFPRNAADESISPSRIKSQSRVRSTITFRSEDSSITDRLASIKSTIKSIDTLCEDQSSRKDKCQRYIDSLFTARPSNSISPTPPISRPLIKIDDVESSRRQHPQERVAMRELKKETSPRRRRDEDREEYESRVRRDMMPNNVDAPSEFSCSLENIAKVDSEVDRINQDKQVEAQLERPLSPYYAPGYDLNNRSITPVVYIPTKLEIRHTTVTSTFYDRFLTEKHIERTFPRSKKHSPVSPTITKSHLDIANYDSPHLDDRNSKSAENSPSRRKDGLSPNQTVSAAAYRRSFISSLEVAQKDLHIRSCDNILLQLRSSTNKKDVVPSIMVYNPLPTKIRKSPELGISLGLYKDYGSDASSKS